MFTKGYVLYVVVLIALAAAAGRWVVVRLQPPTLEDMARPDYVDRPDRVLRKVDHDGLLLDLRPNTHTVAQGVTYETNADGQRDDENHALAKTPGRTRIIFVGDSFTFGWGLELDYGFVKQVETLLGGSRWEVINLGVPGYDTIKEVLHLEQAGLKYSPDLVILMYHLNDAQSAVDTTLGTGDQTFKALTSYYQGELSGAESERVERYLKGAGYPLDPPWNHRTVVWQDRAYLVAHYLPMYWGPTQQALARLEQLSRQHGFKVLVGIIPEISHPWESYPFDDLHARVADEMRSHGFGVLDLHPVLSRFPNRDLMLWGFDGHTSAYANRIIAQTLADRLTAR